MTRWPLPEPMRLALAEAAGAAAMGEVPIGAVVVKDGRVIAAAHNLTRRLPDPTAQAKLVLDHCFTDEWPSVPTDQTLPTQA